MATEIPRPALRNVRRRALGQIVPRGVRARLSVGDTGVLSKKNDGLINQWFPLNKALLNPYFWGGGTLGAGRLTSHELSSINTPETYEGFNVGSLESKGPTPPMQPLPRNSRPY